MVFREPELFNLDFALRLLVLAENDGVRYTGRVGRLKLGRKLGFDFVGELGLEGGRKRRWLA